jgi:hypothetical protein
MLSKDCRYWAFDVNAAARHQTTQGVEQRDGGICCPKACANHTQATFRTLRQQLT